MMNLLTRVADSHNTIDGCLRKKFRSLIIHVWTFNELCCWNAKWLTIVFFYVLPKVTAWIGLPKTFPGRVQGTCFLCYFSVHVARDDVICAWDHVGGQLPAVLSLHGPMLPLLWSDACHSFIMSIVQFVICLTFVCLFIQMMFTRWVHAAAVPRIREWCKSFFQRNWLFSICHARMTFMHHTESLQRCVDYRSSPIVWGMCSITLCTNSSVRFDWLFLFSSPFPEIPCASVRGAISVADCVVEYNLHRRTKGKSILVCLVWFL